jgi:hypothetical protein
MRAGSGNKHASGSGLAGRPLAHAAHQGRVPAGFDMPVEPIQACLADLLESVRIEPGDLAERIDGWSGAAPRPAILELATGQA